MAKKDSTISIIGQGLSIEGTVCSKGKLIIQGTVKGTLEGENVSIAKGGGLYTHTKVVNMDIGGTFEGEMRASGELLIRSSGTCSGKVVCKDLVVEAGGIINADVSCMTVQEDPTSAEGGRRSEETGLKTEGAKHS